MSKLTKTYRNLLTLDEKRRFKKAVQDEGVDLHVRCPLCRTRRQTREQMFRYCEEHHSWELTNDWRVACHVCKLVYGLTGKDPHEESAA